MRGRAKKIEGARIEAVRAVQVSASLSREAAAARRKSARIYRSGDGGIGLQDNEVLAEFEAALRDEAVALLELADAIADARDR